MGGAYTDMVNVFDEKLKNCSRAGTALTGYTRNGKCAHDSSDAGSHHICFAMKQTPSFCETTGQTNWCTKEFPCHGAPKKTCPIENWCVCQWAFANAVEKLGCSGVEVDCDATNMNAVTAYATSRSPRHQKALECLRTKCNGLQKIKSLTHTN